jgi:hypothetical protein
LSDTRQIGQDCPYCSGSMVVSRMSCGHCNISVEATFPMTRLGTLPVEHQKFIEMFVLSGGNLKEIAEQVGVSYPTIRSRLDKVIEALRTEIGKTRRVQGTVLDAVEGKASDAESRAAKLIKGI